MTTPRLLLFIASGAAAALVGYGLAAAVLTWLGYR